MYLPQKVHLKIINVILIRPPSLIINVNEIIKKPDSEVGDRQIDGQTDRCVHNWTDGQRGWMTYG